jgi:streptomycin 6-kinase
MQSPNSLTTLQPNFVRGIIDLFDERGQTWLDNLPNLLAECERRWSLTIHPPLLLSYNYVAPATRADGIAVVLKAGVPHDSLTDEMETLRIWNGRGSVQLLDSDPEAGIMLLERLDPGTALITIEDEDQATLIFARVARQLWQAAPSVHNFDTVHDWAKGLERLRTHFDGGTGPFPKRLVEAAESLYKDLLASQAEPVLLHGDLHHWNILSAQRQPWLAIDPKGIVGERAYEVGAWMRNPVGRILSRSDLPRVFARRADILAEELALDRQRILAWSFAQAVLSAWWSIEDHNTGWEEAVQVAEILSSLMK